MLIVNMPSKPYWLGRQAQSSHLIRLDITGKMKRLASWERLIVQKLFVVIR